MPPLNKWRPTMTANEIGFLNAAPKAVLFVIARQLGAAANGESA